MSPDSEGRGVRGEAGVGGARSCEPTDGCGVRVSGSPGI